MANNIGDEPNELREKLERRDGKIFYCGKELPPGPWHDEPDRFEFEAAGFPCILNRGPCGAWCGYVGVPPGHPWHRKQYDSVRTRDGADESYPDVHGGLTYAHECQGAICHTPKPGEPDDVWWLGFDCIHAGDLAFFDLIELVPGLNRIRDGVYRTIDFVRAETTRLAEQAKAVA